MIESVNTAAFNSSVKPSSGSVAQSQREKNGLLTYELNRVSLMRQSRHSPLLLSVKQQGLLDWSSARWNIHPRYVEEAELRALGLSLNECCESISTNASLYLLVEMLWSLSREAQVIRSLGRST